MYIILVCDIKEKDPCFVIKLVFTPEVICDVLSKRITKWNDAKIIAIQENVTFAQLALPNEDIFVVGYEEDTEERNTFGKIISEYCDDADLSQGDIFVKDFVDAQASVGAHRYSITYGPVSFTEESLITIIPRMRSGAQIYNSINCAGDSFDTCWPLLQTYSMSLPSEFSSSECSDRTAQESTLFADYVFKAMLDDAEDPLFQFGMSRLNPEEQRLKLETLSCFGQSIVNPVEDKQLLANSSVWAARGMALVLIVILGILSIWLFIHRNHPVLKASQVIFSYQMIAGFILQLLAVVTITFQDDGTASQEQLDSSCMATVWLVGIGFCIVYIALVLKAYRVWVIFDNPKLKRYRFSYVELITKEAIILAPVFLLLVLWSAMAPFEYQRVQVAVDEFTGVARSSVGQCHSEGGINFLSPILFYFCLLAFFGVVLSWKNRHVPSEFSEGTYVSVALLLNFELILLTIPVLVLVQDNAAAMFIIKIVALFLITSMTAIVFLGPKVLMVNDIWLQGSHENSSDEPSKKTFSYGKHLSKEKSHPGKKVVDNSLEAGGIVPFGDNQEGRPSSAIIITTQNMNPNSGAL
jgi:hypothetical protein